MSLDRTGLDPWRDLGSIVALRRTFAKLKPDVLLAYTMKPMVYGAVAARLAGVRRVFTMVEGLGYAFADGERAPPAAATADPVAALPAGLRPVPGQLRPQPRRPGFSARAAACAAPGHELVLLDGIGIDLAHYAPSPVPAGPPHFLLIGRLIQDKGIAAFAAAARRVKLRHPHARFTLLGGFDNSPGAIEPRQVAAWQAEGLLDYAGTTDDVRPFIRRRLGLRAAVQLPRGRAALVARGAWPWAGRSSPPTRPAVARRSSTARTAFSSPSTMSTGLAEALGRFAADPTLAAKMGSASRQLAERRFDDRQVNRAIIEAMRL